MRSLKQRIEVRVCGDGHWFSQPCAPKLEKGATPTDTRSVGAEQFAYSPQSEAVATTEPAGLSGGEGGGETGNP